MNRGLSFVKLPVELEYTTTRRILNTVLIPRVLLTTVVFVRLVELSRQLDVSHLCYLMIQTR